MLRGYLCHDSAAVVVWIRVASVGGVDVTAAEPAVDEFVEGVRRHWRV